VQFFTGPVKDNVQARLLFVFSCFFLRVSPDCWVNRWCPMFRVWNKFLGCDGNSMMSLHIYMIIYV